MKGQPRSYEEYLDQYDFSDERTVSIFEYTKRAVQKMDQILSSLEFEIRDAQTIYQYLTREGRPLPFCAYLKRYLYLQAGLEEPFEAVTDGVYEEMIRNAFFENHMTFSWRPTKKRDTEIIRGWLTRETVHRKTVFLLGFGLGMDDKDVTDFLTKALRERDFDFYDPTETVYWYSLHYRMGYTKAKQILEEMEREPAGQEAAAAQRAEYLRSVAQNPKVCLWKEETLREYLRYVQGNQAQGEEQAYLEFQKLYLQVRGLCQKGQDAGPYEIEKLLCCGIPRDSNGNLRKIGESTLAVPFGHHKMSRQRMKLLLNRERPVHRFDLLTFLFYLCCQRSEGPNQRRDQFILQANACLSACRMAELYFTNPYEVFLVMCLMTDDPLTTYGDVWELSYR